MYGKKSPDFVRGFLACMDYFAVWREGKRHIGGMEGSLGFAMRTVVRELAEVPEDFEKDIELYT